jgi:hypothetical protein
MVDWCRTHWEGSQGSVTSTVQLDWANRADTVSAVLFAIPGKLRCEARSQAPAPQRHGYSAQYHPYL